MSRRVPVWRRSALALGVLLVVAAASTVPRVHRVLGHDAQRRLATALGIGPTAGADLEAALRSAGVTGIRVSGHHVTIRGVPRPDAEVQRLEEAVRGDGVASASYVVDPGAVLAPGTQVGAIDVTARLVAGTMMLQGTVQSDAQRTTLRAAAEFAFGAGRVRDTVQIVNQGPRDATSDERVSNLAVLLTNTARATDVEVHLGARVLVVRAVVADPAGRDLLVSLAEALRPPSGTGSTIDVRVGGTAVASVTTVR